MGMEMRISGGTSTEAFGRAFDEAMKNPDVGAIVIDCDSPGGSVSGVPELAAKIFKARGQGKRSSRVANSSMNSAAYWICSAADEIIAAPSADVGSIGVFTMHTDTSECRGDRPASSAPSSPPAGTRARRLQVCR
jgi:ClpP class serine protease